MTKRPNTGPTPEPRDSNSENDTHLAKQVGDTAIQVTNAGGVRYKHLPLNAAVDHAFNAPIKAASIAPT